MAKRKEEDIEELKPKLKNTFRERHDIEEEGGRKSEEGNEENDTDDDDDDDDDNVPKIKREQKPRKPRTKKKSSLAETFEPVSNFFRNEKVHKIFALFLLLSSAYLTIAFVSFFITWESDQDKVTGPWGELFLSEEPVQNWLGKLGALVSHLFIHEGFGIASMVFPLVFLVSGARILFGRSILPVAKTIKWSFFALVFFSITLGYIFNDRWFALGGTFGYQMSLWLNTTIGFIGTGCLIFFSALVFMVINFNINFKLPEKEEVLEDESFDVTQDDIKNEYKPDVLINVNQEETVSEEGNRKSEEGNILLTDNEEEDPIEELESEPADESEQEEEGIHVGDSDVMLTIEKTLPPNDFGDNENDKKAEELVQEFGEFDPTLELGNYQFPTLDLLNNYDGKTGEVDQQEINANANRIVQTLKDYGIEIDKIKATIGPTVTLYEIIPKAGVRISKIKNLEDDIALSLSALGIRIIAPIPGKGTIGIEVPNMNPETVSMKTLLASEKFQNTHMELPIALGKTIANETFIADLAKMPHLLMAGATGQGKSVGLNAVLVSLLYKKHPSQIKFVLVDPKKVELNLYNKIERHFLAKLPDSEESIITDNKKVINTLNSLCIEMDNRYELLKNAGVRNIKEYNVKFTHRKLSPANGHRYLPYIVLVVDEFADLIMTAGKEVEIPIARLAQLARAIGIHLIIATQRPSVNIITGTIKANFPARIAFRVTSKIDSRTILDSGGAEQLIGRGDMLLSTGNDLIRLQCAFVDTPEVEKICQFIGAQKAYPSAHLLPEYAGEDESGAGEMDPSERDALFADAARIVVTHQQGSASLLQRKLQLGYNRAGRIVDQLEAAGIIGPFKGSKAREVLFKDIVTLEQFLNKGVENP
jgi:DNA segregation ATPase FtsK/SpoIIIE, S-DNA-T family